MKGILGYFWIIYMFFFVIPFPMLMYYNTDYGVTESDGGTAPWLALTYLAVSVIAWIYLLTSWFKKWVLLPFRMRKDVLRLLKNGVKKKGRVLVSKEQGVFAAGIVTMEITFALQNFSGTEIKEQYVIHDTKPAERRYDVGKTIGVLVDDTLKARPYLTLEGATVGLRMGRMILLSLAWLAVAAAVAGYYCFSYVLENYGTGWRFLKFYHPLVLCGVILLASGIGWRWLLRMIAGSPENGLELKYYGILTEAAIVAAAQTGTYINEQPEIRFELRYQDQQGRTQNASVKKIVPLLELDITKQATVPIFYLKDKPQEVAFASDMEV
ncbi:hypothetical protein [Chitinophaga nivalis]|uniref:DUF3592 domain-containing protein n=1 Tax=Chitinophaga nivalis TaxID=2991709 RepID=A0ABT3IM17_9BACT|nr:hypothetical protein [Chitinophaga nivalis]MCW3465298.1 hypothetical protein [Chitinophaga nivalis]MCW3485010.1 hypothetical protein [Chitinophaga nivalis]